jgi:hypothetical protein
VELNESIAIEENSCNSTNERESSRWAIPKRIRGSPRIEAITERIDCNRKN